MSLLENVRENFSSQEKNVFKTFARRATKVLQLRPSKATVVHALKEYDPVAGIHSCNQFLQSVDDGD
jgi:rhamnose utilization protein RhaD (predicted bifunctional aldolase and dehydrogenase)